MELVGLDFIGRLATTKKGNEHLLVAIDYFSKWVISKPTKDTSSNTVANFIVHKIVCKHGAPERILCDNGSGFTARLVDQLTKMLGINKIQCTPYHHKGNALVERTNQTIQDKMSMIINSGPDIEWDEAAKFATFAINTTKQKSTGYSPFEIVHGRTARLPTDPLNDTKCEIEYVKALATKLELINRNVNSNLQESSARLRSAMTPPGVTRNLTFRTES